MAQRGKSRPDSGFGFQSNVLETFQVIPFSLGRGYTPRPETLNTIRGVCAVERTFFFFFTLVTGPRRSLRLNLSDTRDYTPQIRARLGTTAHLCKVVVEPGKYVCQPRPDSGLAWSHLQHESHEIRFRSLLSRPVDRPAGKPGVK